MVYSWASPQGPQLPLRARVQRVFCSQPPIPKLLVRGGTHMDRVACLKVMASRSLRPVAHSWATSSAPATSLDVCWLTGFRDKCQMCKL